jgi:predicted Zn-dependent protease
MPIPCFPLSFCRKTLLVGLLAAVAAGAMVGADKKQPPLSQLLDDAELVWKQFQKGELTDVERQGVALVAAGEALRAKGKLAEAREQYRRASLLRPWDFATKLQTADVLKRMGQAEAAQLVAAQVARLAESDATLAQCSKFCSVPVAAPLPTSEQVVPNEGEVVVVLIPAKGFDEWLLRGVGHKIAERLGVRVGVMAEPFDLGKCTRTGRALIAKELRRTLPWSDPRVSVPTPDGQRLKPEMLNDDQVLEVGRLVLMNEMGEAAAAQLDARLAAADQTQQWDATGIMQVIQIAHPQPTSARIVYMVLVPVDIYASQSDFVYGSASVTGNYAVVSSYRYTAAFTGEPQSSKRLMSRTVKQALSSVGFALGVVRCSDPGCARSYAGKMAEQDAKEDGLCPECRAAFAKVVGHPLPGPAAE